jgi:hypothetical protein
MWPGGAVLTNIIINTLVSYVELFGALICALTIFRLPIKYQLPKILVINLISSIITTYTFAYFPDFAILINFSCLVIMLTVSYELPFFYALLVAFVYFFTAGIIEYANTLIATNLFQMPDQLISPGKIGSRIINVVTGVLLLLLALGLERKKIGFMFISKYFTMRKSVKGYNFALSAVLIMSIVSIQLASLMYNKLSIHFYILIVLTALFLAGITIAYRQNKKQLREKHERLNNR